ncbi:hypothetical protein [Mycobacteroides abscessus]|uniref:hypothetical protein n=1 Tax=Mycobacteroides abscessus TaxID=36809 RepID=UPI001896A375
MSDEPSDAQKLMAEVLKPLIYADMRYPDELFAQRRAEAYAAEVDKALGGLTREWATGYGYPCPSAGDFVAVETFRTREEAKAQSDRVMAYDRGLTRREEARFVSGWTVTK